MTRKKGSDLTTLHKRLGVVAFGLFCALNIADLVGYDVSPKMAFLVFLAFLVLLGFGSLVGDIIEGVR